MTLTVAMSDAEIRRQAARPEVGRLRAAQHPALRLRFLEERTRGSWDVRAAGEWKRFAGWPELNTKAALAVLPEVLARLAADPEAVVGRGGWSTVGELLEWYRERVMRDRKLSAKRKTSVKSAIDCHLLPRLSSLPLATLNRSTVDQALMWPLQETLSPSYVRLILRVLTMAFKQARRLELIAEDPLASVKFTDFVQARIKPKAARLHVMDAGQLLASLAARFEQAPLEGMLAALMLAHGTRVGETRMARWRHISLSERVWLIPAENTKTRTEHVLPLTEQACALLRRYRAIQEAKGGDPVCLFPGRDGKPIGDKTASAIFSSLGGGQWSSHDLRKMARTGWAELGVDYLIGELLLNHAMGFAAQTYINTSADDLKLDALTRWHAWLDERGFAAIHGGTLAVSSVSRFDAQAAPVVACSDFRELQKERL